MIDILRKEKIEKDNIIETYRKQSLDHLKQNNIVLSENSQLVFFLI